MTIPAPPPPNWKFLGDPTLNKEYYDITPLSTPYSSGGGDGAVFRLMWHNMKDNDFDEW